jgi:hypothetical protein
VCLRLHGGVHRIPVLSPKATTQAGQHPEIMSESCLRRLCAQQSVSPTVHERWPQPVESRFIWVRMCSYIRGVPAYQHVKGTLIWQVDRSMCVMLNRVQIVW